MSATRKIRLIHVAPGAANLQPLISKFAVGGEGILTCLSDQRLRACRALLPDESLIETLAFGEVTGRFLSMAGGKAMPLAQNGHFVAAIAEACEHLPSDSPFLASAHFPGAHDRIGQAMEELHGWGMDAEDLDRLAVSCGPYLAGKLRSLAFIERDVKATLAQLGRQLNVERIRDALATRIGPDVFFGRLMVVASSEAEPGHIDFVRWASACADTTVIVESHPGLPQAFAAAGIWERALGVLPEVLGSLNKLAEGIFQSAPATSDREVSEVTAPLGVAIRTAADPLAEAEWAIRGCLEATQTGTQFGEIAILARNLESYAPVLESAARRLGLPVSLTRRSPLLTNSFAKLHLGFLEFCASEDVRDLAKVLRSSYLSLSHEDQSEIRAAVHGAYSSGHEQWKQLEEWAALNEEKHPWLSALLAWRKEAMGESAPLPRWIERLRRLGELPLHFNEFDPTGLRDERAQSSMQRALAQTASVMVVRGNPQIELRDFARLCRRLWGEADMTLPAREFGVRVVRSAEELGTVGTLFVLGMLEGVFPRRRSEDPILTDDERAEISALREGQPLRNSHDRAREERDEFVRVCAAPSARLVFSYPQTDEDRDNVPAFYLTEVRRIVPDVDTADFKRSKLTPELEACQAPADRTLCEALLAPREDPLPNQIKTEDAANAIRGLRDRSYHVKELRDVLQCPFYYTARWPMKFRKQQSPGRWTAMQSLPAKARLAAQMSPETAKGALEQQLEVEVLSHYAEASPHELATMRAGGRRLIEEWVEREFLSREIWKRDNVIDGNVYLGSDYMRNSVKTSIGRVTLQGDVPAVSERDGYLIAHLYKASDPLDDNFARRRDADLAWRELKPREGFEVGLYLLALTKPQNGVGVEIDSMSGQRRLFVMPRRDPPLQNPQDQGFRVMPIDAANQPDLVRDIVPQIERAVTRIQEPMVEAIPDEHCTYCEYGELCRRSRDFGEVLDPFQNDDYEPAE